MLVERGIDADKAVSVLEALAAERGAPAHLRCDNGPEMTGHALKDWCVLSNAGTAFIEPGSPWQNPFVESFVRHEALPVRVGCKTPPPGCRGSPAKLRAA